MFLCPKCDGPVFVHGILNQRLDFLSGHGDIRDWGNAVYIRWIEPTAATSEAPAGTPERAATAYVEACSNLQIGSWTSAAAMFRRAMEIALKQLAPDVEAWKLEKRIDKLAAEHMITPAIQAWAHDLRLDGNEALHGDEPASEELARRMERLAHFLFVYLFELPLQVKLAQEARAENN